MARVDVNKYKSFDVVDRLVSRLAELDGPRRQFVDRVSLHRGFHTAGLVLADRTDDSHGNVGEARTTAWATYLSLDWRSAGVEPAGYWRDLCALLIWEPYAIDHQAETAWFTQVHADEIGLVAQILREFEADATRGDSRLGSRPRPRSRGAPLPRNRTHRRLRRRGDSARVTIVAADRRHGRTRNQIGRPGHSGSSLRCRRPAGLPPEAARRPSCQPRPQQMIALAL